MSCIALLDACAVGVQQTVEPSLDAGSPALSTDAGPDVDAGAPASQGSDAGLCAGDLSSAAGFDTLYWSTRRDGLSADGGLTWLPYNSATAELSGGALLITAGNAGGAWAWGGTSGSPIHLAPGTAYEVDLFLAQASRPIRAGIAGTTGLTSSFDVSGAGPQAGGITGATSPSFVVYWPGTAAPGDTFALCSVGIRTVDAGTQAPPDAGIPFPRLAASWISNQHYDDPAIQRQLARGSIAIINTWPGWRGKNGETLETCIQAMHALNPKTLVFEYVIIDSVASATNSPWVPVFQEVEQMNWWAYAQGTSGTITSLNPGFPDVNTTLFTPKDSQGRNWLDWAAEWFTQTLATPTPSLAGVCTDNIFLKPRVDADWNRDGVTDSQTDPVVGQWYRAGYQYYFQHQKALLPGKLQIGNIAEWGDPAGDLTLYQGMLNGGVMEGMIGYSWSLETWATWQYMMASYRRTMSALAEPRLAIFGQVGATTTDYQSVRYGLTSTLMDDGYYQFNTTGAGGGDAPYFDEYDNGGAGTGYLGAALAGPSLTPWQNGVYRRDFAGGIALVNPRGNGAQTVTLNGTFRHLTGIQDRGVNDGSLVTSVTLQDRDGVILLR